MNKNSYKSNQSGQGVEGICQINSKSQVQNTMLERDKA